MTESKSLRLQLNEFFKRCPDGDYLTTEDASAKYNVDLTYAYRTLKAMASDGAIEAFKVQSSRRNVTVVAYRAVVVEVL